MNLKKEVKVISINDLYIFDELFRVTESTVSFLRQKYPNNRDITLIYEQFDLFTNGAYSNYAYLASEEIAEGRRDPLCENLQRLITSCFDKLEQININLDKFIDFKRLGRELQNVIQIEEYI